MTRVRPRSPSRVDVRRPSTAGRPSVTLLREALRYCAESGRLYWIERPREHVDVIDAVAQATPGASRMSVLLEQKLHESMLIQRVTSGNGTAPESGRNRAGRGRE